MEEFRMVMHSHDDLLLVSVIDNTMDVPLISREEYYSALEQNAPKSLDIGEGHLISCVCYMTMIKSVELTTKLVFAECSTTSLFFNLTENNQKVLIDTGTVEADYPNVEIGDTLKDLISRGY